MLGVIWSNCGVCSGNEDLIRIICFLVRLRFRGVHEGAVAEQGLHVSKQKALALAMCCKSEQLWQASSLLCWIVSGSPVIVVLQRVEYRMK